MWELPDCDRVEGTSAVTFTRNGGRTLAPREGVLPAGTRAVGLAALDQPNALLAEVQGTLLRSTDAGCRWAALESLPQEGLLLTAAADGHAFLWEEEGSLLWRFDPTGLVALTSPVENILGIGVDRTMPGRIVLGGEQGEVWQSTDGGAHWERSGAVSLAYPFVRRFVFAPQDPAHLLVGLQTPGALVSFDGGAVWHTARGLESGRVLQAALSPCDTGTVWVMAREETSTPPAIPGIEMALYLSRDGGCAFRRVLSVRSSLVPERGPVLAAHPADRNALYFVIGHSLIRYNARTRHLRRADVRALISAIAFSPADPSLLYLGLTSEA